MARGTFTEEFSNVEQIDTTEGYKDWTILDGTASISLETINEDNYYWASEPLVFYGTTIDSTRTDYIIKVEIGITGYANYPSDLEFELGNRSIVTVVGETLHGFLIDETSSTSWVDITQDIEWTWQELSEYGNVIQAVNFKDLGDNWDVVLTKCEIRVTYSTNPPGNFGLQCWDSSGLIILDTSDRITRVLFSTVAAADTSGSDTFEMPDGGSSRTYAFSIPINATGENRAHNVSVSNNTVSWTPVSLTDTVGGDVVTIYDSCDSLIVVVGW